MQSPILAPMAALVLWSMAVLVWLTVARFGAISRLPRDRRRALATPGTRGADLEPLLPARATWAAHNYTHLMEQPTAFYAAATVLALAGAGGGTNLTLAWSYAGLRILHSLWQASVNKLPVRMLLFTASSLCLIALVIKAVGSALA